MFDSDQTDKDRPLFWTTLGTLFSIVIATFVTGWLILEVRTEQMAVESMLQHGAPRVDGNLRFLSGELRWQLPLTFVVLSILMTTAVTFVFLSRAFSKSQNKLRETKALAWDILAHTDRGVITANQEGCITSINPEASKFFAWDAHCLGKPLASLCRNGVPLAEIAQRVLDSGVAEYDCNFSLQRHDHDLRLRADCNVLRSPSGKISGVVLHLRDVTERILIEDQVRRMERFMGLGSLAASLHHEIKNPLSALSLHVQLLEERLTDNIDAEARETLHVLETEIARINGVLNSFRDYASVDKLNLESTDISNLVQRVADLMRPQASQQGVRIKSKCTTQTPPFMLADGARLEQVVLNLVLNALEVMPNGGELNIEIGANEEQLTIAIADTGPGIPASIRHRIFDPFFTTKPRGSGMGLAFCDKIVQEHGGQIDFETSPSGTRFQVTLPLQRA